MTGKREREREGEGKRESKESERVRERGRVEWLGVDKRMGELRVKRRTRERERERERQQVVIIEENGGMKGRRKETRTIEGRQRKNIDRHKEINGIRQINTYTHTNKHTHIHTHRETNTHTHTHTDRPIGTLMGRGERRGGKERGKKGKRAVMKGISEED